MLGNKAKNLELLRNTFGERVPAFFVLRGADYISLELLSEYEGELNELNAAAISQKIRNAITERFREQTIGKLKNAMDIPWELSAVRSSSSLEDGANASFAGQFDTYLNVPKAEAAERVWDCFLSLFNENVLLYLIGSHLPLSSLCMSVIVQEMVNADCAGVLFGANPLGLLNESVITVDEGLGENVVGGRTRAVSYYYNTTDKIYYYEGEKDLLSREQIEELIEISEQIKDKLQISYPDIEFAIRNGRIYLLQVRPVTTLSIEENSCPLIFDNSNIVESYPGISLPLTCSFVNLVYGGVFRDLCRRVLKNQRLLDMFEPVFYNMVGHANGRIYYKITNWYSILLVLPFNRKIIPVWQEMLGVKTKSFERKSVRMTPFQRMMTYVNIFAEFFETPKNMEKLNETFLSVQAYYDESFREGLSNAELMKIFETLREKLFSCWGVTLLNDMLSFVFTSLLKKRLSKKYKVSPDALNDHIAGISNIESMKPVKTLVDLCFDKPSLSEAEYQRRFDDYIRMYGDRNLEELKLESRTFRSTPSLLTEKINEYIKDIPSLSAFHARLHEDEQKREETKYDVLTRFLRSQCSRGIANREISRLNRSRIYGFVRSIVEAMGKNLVRDGILDEFMDIHYLTLEEILRITGEKSGDAYFRHVSDAYLTDERTPKEIVASRKREYEIFRLLPGYSRLVFAHEAFDKMHASVNAREIRLDVDMMQGTPCSAGIVTAEAYVVHDVTQVKDVSGKILVTKMTDPGWVFLLTSASGVISEKGSLLSHTSIISRELGIPSVVGVQNLMNSIQTGDLLRMNGNTGTVEILKRAHETNGEEREER